VSAGAADPTAGRELLLEEAVTEQRLGPAEREVRDAVRDVVARVVAPAAAAVDAGARFPGEEYRALADAGLAGLLVPPEYGGTGHSVLAYVAAMEEISAGCGSTATVYMTQMHAAYPILVAGDEAQRTRWLPGLCSGEALGSLCVTEPDAGSDVAAMRTTARRDGDAYVLSGGKTFITTGDRADVLVVFATVDRQAGRDGITAFVVEGDTPGLSRGRVLHKLGQRGSTTAELFFDGCRVPAPNRLGSEGSGWALSMASVVKSRLSAAAQGIGFARGAFEHARRWADERRLLRGAEGVAQEVQFGLAEARARIAAARALLYETAALVDGGAADAVTEVSMAKLVCTDCAMETATRMVELLGEDGDLIEFGVERFLRDAKVTQIYDGTNQIQRLLIARSLRG
jgi:alkylation response protein AidB-like acyl-CoA dehydrogenase